MRVFISGQKYFGAEIFRVCVSLGFEVAGVCAPFNDTQLRRLALAHDVPVMDAGTLSAHTCPKNIELGIAAHSFDYVGKATRYIPRHGWIGFHPSLLPRHRGRSSIEWAIRMRDFITGGTVYWLNAGIDRGDIERQREVWVDPKYFSIPPKDAAAELWRSEIAPLGVELMREALKDISAGIINKRPQDSRFSTFEPSTDVKDIFRPDALMIPAPGSIIYNDITTTIG